MLGMGVLVSVACTKTEAIDTAVTGAWGSTCSVEVAPEPETQRLATINVDGVTRRFRLTVPTVEAGVDLPVIFAFHGGGQRDEPFEQQNQFDEFAQENQVIIAYMMAELLEGNEGEWQINTANDSQQDIRFVDALIDEMSERYCVDQSRIYAMGYSLGGMFVYDLACHLNSRFAAIASVAGSMPIEPNSCVIDDPVALLHIHGQYDSIIPYADEWDWKNWDEVGRMMDVPSVIDFWGDKYNCQSSHEDSISDALFRRGYSDCDGDVLVEHFRRNQGDHEWPWSMEGTLTPNVLWTFFSQFSNSE
jgi:polyhydroxybutyrate depolymerase